MSTQSTLTPQKFDEVEEALKDVMDPELGINVVDLGLIYDLAWDDENDALIIHMTLTSAGCPLTDVLEEQTAEALDGVVDAFRINWVWMPPWGPDRITDDGRDMMRALGFSMCSSARPLVDDGPTRSGWGRRRVARPSSGGADGPASRTLDRSGPMDALDRPGSTPSAAGRPSPTDRGTSADQKDLSPCSLYTNWSCASAPASSWRTSRSG